MKSLVVVFGSAAPEQLLSHELFLGRMGTCPDGAGSEVWPVQPWGTARGTAGTVPLPGLEMRAMGELHRWLELALLLERLQGDAETLLMSV